MGLGWMEGSAFFPRRFFNDNVGGQKNAFWANSSTIYRNIKSSLMDSILGTLVVRVVLVGHSQPNMVRRGQGRLVFESRVWPFRPFWSTLRTVLRSTLVPKPPRGSFPSAITYPEPGPRLRQVLHRNQPEGCVVVQVPQVAHFAFCPTIGND